MEKENKRKLPKEDIHENASRDIPPASYDPPPKPPKQPKKK